MKKSKIINMLRSILAYAIFIILFLFVVFHSLSIGYNIYESLYFGVLISILIIVGIGLLILLCWRLFTKEGREAEKEAQARYWIKKEERKLERQWRRMND